MGVRPSVGKAYCAWAGVGDLPGVGHPLVSGTFLVGKGSIEDHANVSHGVDANGRAFEDRTETRRGEKIFSGKLKHRKKKMLIFQQESEFIERKNQPGDSKDSIYDRILGVLRWLDVNVT